MSISVIDDPSYPAPRVKHLDCDYEMSLVTYFVTGASICFLMQCDKCKKVEAVHR